jgi:DNA-damage-inducible protein J
MPALSTVRDLLVYGPYGLFFYYIRGGENMAKISTVRARIEPELKAEVEKLFKQLGLSTTEAINLFYRQIKMRKGLPFNVVIPNKTTEKVFKETDLKRNLIRCNGTDDMFKKLEI